MLGLQPGENFKITKESHANCMFEFHSVTASFELVLKKNEFRINKNGRHVKVEQIINLHK